MFARLGPWCHDRRKLVLFLWIAALVVFNVIASSVGDAYRQDFTLKGFESTDGFKLLEEEFPDGPASPQFGTIVFQAEEDVRDPAVREPMEALFEEVRQLEHVTLVESPYDPGGERQIATQGDAAGTDRGRQRLLARGHRLHRRRRSREPDRGDAARRGSARRARRLSVRGVRGTVIGAVRAGVRDRDPDRRVRIGPRDGSAGRRRAVRHRYGVGVRRVARAT